MNDSEQAERRLAALRHQGTVFDLAEVQKACDRLQEMIYSMPPLIAIEAGDPRRHVGRRRHHRHPRWKRETRRGGRL